MSLVVYKYMAHWNQNTVDAWVTMPQGATVVSVGLGPVYDKHCVWLLVDTDRPVVKRRVVIFETGQPVPEGWMPAGSLTEGAYRWHIFLSPEENL